MKYQGNFWLKYYFTEDHAKYHIISLFLLLHGLWNYALWAVYFAILSVYFFNWAIYCVIWMVHFICVGTFACPCLVCYFYWTMPWFLHYNKHILHNICEFSFSWATRNSGIITRGKRTDIALLIVGFTLLCLY